MPINPSSFDFWHFPLSASPVRGRQFLNAVEFQTSTSSGHVSTGQGSGQGGIWASECWHTAAIHSNNASCSTSADTVPAAIYLWQVEDGFPHGRTFTICNFTMITGRLRRSLLQPINLLTYPMFYLLCLFTVHRRCSLWFGFRWLRNPEEWCTKWCRQHLGSVHSRIRWFLRYVHECRFHHSFWRLQWWSPLKLGKAR